MTDPSAAYIARELASERRPAELFRFWAPSEGSEWLYTSGDAAVEYRGKSYEPLYIRRSSVSSDTDLKVTSLDIEADCSAGPFDRFVTDWPVEQVWCEVYKLFRDDLTEAQVVFLGQIGGAEIEGATARVEAVGFEHFLGQKVPRYRDQVTCNLMLFDEACGAVRGLWKVEAAPLVSADGLTLTAAAFAGKADGWFTWGYVAAGGTKRLIAAHAGSQIQLRYRIAGLVSGDAAVAYAGCDRTLQTCVNKFGNGPKFLGAPHIPRSSPITRMPGSTAGPPTGAKK